MTKLQVQSLLGSVIGNVHNNSYEHNENSVLPNTCDFL
jgi:hypothetical protein